MCYSQYIKINLAETPRCYLSGGLRLLVAGQDFEHDAAAGLLQHLLEHAWVVPYVLPVHFLYDVPYMKETLLIDHPSVQNPSDHQFSVLNPESHALKREESEQVT